MHGHSRVGVRELRQNLSVYLDRVKRGESLTVTEHGAVVAELRPASAQGGILERLVSDGLAVAPTRNIRELPRPLQIRLKRPLSAILADDREDRI